MNGASFHENSRVLMAIIMASIMIASTLVVLSPSVSEGDEGTSVSPVIIAGSPLKPYELGTDGSFTTYIGFNLGDFSELSPHIRITSGGHTFLDAQGSVTPTQSLSYTDSKGVKTTLGFPGMDSYSFNNDNGLYTLTFEFDGDENDIGVTSILTFRIWAELTAYVSEEGSTETVAIQDTRDFYYRAYITVVESPSEVSLYLTSSPGTDDSAVESVTVPAGEEITPIYPFVMKTQKHYDFYAVGLPDGINMISDGTICGKPAASIAAGTVYDVKVYAVYNPEYVEYDEENEHNYGYPVPGTDVRMVYAGDLEITVTAPVDAFKYRIGDTTRFYSTVGYSAIANVNPLEIEIIDEGETGTFKAYATNGESIEEVTIADDKIVLDDLSDRTGVMQIKVVESFDNYDFTATIHIMLVGPIVHSGLNPSLTSS